LTFRSLDAASFSLSSFISAAEQHALNNRMIVGYKHITIYLLFFINLTFWHSGA